MKRVCFVLCICLVFLSACSFQRADEVLILRETIDLTTEDNLHISAHWYPTSSEKGVILVHSLKNNKESWGTVPGRLQDMEINVLAIDLRGHGESDWAGTTLQGADFKNMESDIAAALDFFIEQGINRITIVGASIGANNALNFAEKEGRIEKVILLSPGLDYRDVLTEETIKTYQRPLFIMVGKEDWYAADSSKTLYDLSQSKKKLKIFDNARHGESLVKVDTAAQNILIGWIQE